MAEQHDRLIVQCRDWLRFAERDLWSARQLLAPPDGVCSTAAYLAQQAAEKSLKAYLTFRAVDFPFTHNIAVLRELCSGHGRWAELIAPADELTRYSTTARYPSVGAEPDRAEAERCIAIAVTVHEAVTKALADEGVSV